MNQEELEARLAQIAPGGDTSKLKHSPTVTKKTVKNPNALANGGNDKNAPAENEYTVMAWENPQTGARVEAYVGADGKYIVEKDVPGTKTPDAAAGPQRTPDGQRVESANATTAELNAAEAVRIRNESQWNADPKNRANGGSGRYEDHATRDARLDKERKDADAKTEADARNNRPAVSIEEDGKGGLVAISVDPKTGTATTKPIPGVAGKPDRFTHEGAVYQRQPDGTYKPIINNQAPEPTGAPRQRIGLGEITQDLLDYSEFLNEKVRKGELTPAQADDLLKKRRETATTSVQEQTALTNAQRGIFADEVGQRQDNITETASRRTAAGTSFSKALETHGDTSKSGKGSGRGAAEAILASLDLGRANAAKWGGMEEYQDIGLPPFLASLRNRTTDPKLPATGNALGVGTGIVPAAPAAAAPTGATGASAASDPLTTGGIPPTAPAAAPPTAGEPGGPPLAPGPVLGDPSATPTYHPGATTDSPADAALAPASAAPPAADGNERPDDILTVRDDNTGQTHRLTRARYEQEKSLSPTSRTTVLNAEPASARQPGDLDVDPEPTTAPAAPSGPVAVPDAGAPYSPGASSTSGPWNPATGQPHMPDPQASPTAPQASMMPPPWVDQARYGAEYSPNRILSMLVADPDLDTSDVLEAYKQVTGAKPKQGQAGMNW